MTTTNQNPQTTNFADVAPLLGDGWTYAPEQRDPFRRAALRHESGYHLSIIPRPHGKVELYFGCDVERDQIGQGMNFFNDRNPRPTIMMSANKSADLMAKDIRRRLIADASEQYATLRDSHRRRGDEIEHRERRARRIAEIMGDTYRGNAKLLSVFQNDGSPVTYQRVERLDCVQVNLELQVSDDAAYQILGFVRSLNDEHRRQTVDPEA